MATAITLNKKPAEATTPGGLRFVLTTTLSITPGKDQDSARISPAPAHFKPF